MSRRSFAGKADDGLMPRGLCLGAVDGPKQDRQFAQVLRGKWRCSCGHVEIAPEPAELRRLALEHHAVCPVRQLDLMRARCQAPQTLVLAPPEGGR
jgi:hypothetical protein